MLLVNMYLPNNNVENPDQEIYLGRFTSIIDDGQELNVCILGQFNATPETTFFTNIQYMCNDLDMVGVS